MITEKVLEKIQHQLPRLIYISGKTCTGKTTFAKYLSQHGYKKVELDHIVTESVIIPFNVVPAEGFRTAYRGLGSEEQVGAFTNSAKLEILKELQKSSVVVEGAIASPQILGEIFSDNPKDFVFIYLHPAHADTYEERIRSRFVVGAKNGTSGLPKDFWELVKQSDFDEFKNTNKVNSEIETAIKEYAAKSMRESEERLASFQSYFQDIAVVKF